MIIELSCTEAWQVVSETIDDTLSEEMRRRVELHLAHCSHCRAVFDGTRNVVTLIGDEEALSLPPGFSQRLFKALSPHLC